MSSSAGASNMEVDIYSVNNDTTGTQEHQTVAQTLPFNKFVKICEKVANASTNKDRQARLRKFFATFRTIFKQIHGSLNSDLANGDSIFSVIRILCPSRDRERSSYGIKDTVLGRMFAKIIGIDKTSKEGKMLYNYKNPDIVGSIAGDMGAIVYSVLSRRLSTGAADGPSVYDLHQVLDQLAKNKDFDDIEDKVTLEKQITILQGFIRRLNALEGKWLAKIILKKMDLGISESSIFNLIHPKARELLDITSLEEMCQICNDPDVEYVPTGIVTLFTCFKSMLCVRLNMRNAEDDEGSENPRKEIISPTKTNPLTLPPPPFIIETKFDGERFQVHFERRDSGDFVFRYFSRGSHEYKEFNQTLTPRLKGQLVQSPPVNSFIIDGEMMAYNYHHKNFTTKGQNIDVKTLRQDNSHHCPAFIAWDLVYYNGESICDKPLTVRMDLLKKILIQKEGVYYISEQRQRNSLEEVLELLDEAIENCEEGIIIKDRNSAYAPGQRKSTWLKLKPEYVEGCRVNDLDLLIIGGYYADKKRQGGRITSLVLGLLDGKDVYPITDVGCGRLKHREMASLIKSLEPHFVKQEIPGVKFKGKRPDVFIDPKKSIVLEVNASEINYSKEYVLNYCLRFPVLTRVRRDKPWNEAMTVKEFHDLRLSCKQGKMVRKREGASSSSNFRPKRQYYGKAIDFNELSSGDEAAGPSNYHRRADSTRHGAGAGAATTKKGKAKFTISPTKLLALTSVDADEVALQLEADERHESNTLQGRVFNVIGAWQWKNDMEKKIIKHGGEIVKNPTHDTFAIIADKESITTNNKKKGGKWDILRGSIWVDKCISADKICPYVPSDLIFGTEATRATFADEYDEYGDSYTAEVSVHELKNLLEKVATADKSEDEEEDMDKIRSDAYREIAKVDKEYFNTWHFFSKCRIAFFPETDIALKAYVEFYRGTVVEDYNSRDVTHIVFMDDTTEPPPNNSVPVVTENWITDCANQKKLLDVSTYLV